eukprot:99230-Karenia_brevis.AAC.1
MLTRRSTYAAAPPAEVGPRHAHRKLGRMQSQQLLFAGIQQLRHPQDGLGRIGIQAQAGPC